MKKSFKSSAPKEGDEMSVSLMTLFEGVSYEFRSGTPNQAILKVPVSLEEEDAK